MGGPASGPYSTSWPEETVDHLKYLLIQGLTAAEIAKRIGNISRCAIIGKCHRDGMTLERSPHNPNRPKKESPRRRRSLGFHIAGKIPRPPKAVLEKVEPAKPDVVLPTSLPVGLLELNHNTCRWPIGEPCKPDFFFCGAYPEMGKPYCSDHCAIAYHKPLTISEQDRQRRRFHWIQIGLSKDKILDEAA